jgi:hypothetical protein
MASRSALKTLCTAFHPFSSIFYANVLRSRHEKVRTSHRDIINSSYPAILSLGTDNRFALPPAETASPYVRTQTWAQDPYVFRRFVCIHAISTDASEYRRYMGVMVGLISVSESR